MRQLNRNKKTGRIMPSKMRLCDVPKYPAYLVFHDAFMDGAMDVYPYKSLIEAMSKAKEHNEANENAGEEEAGIWAAYEKLPRKRVWKFYPRPEADEPGPDHFCGDCLGNRATIQKLNPDGTCPVCDGGAK